MSRQIPRRYMVVLLAGYILCAAGSAIASDLWTLSAVTLKGTTRLSVDDMIRGLNLKVGGQTTRQDLLEACDHLRRLKQFELTQCRYSIGGRSISLSIFVRDTERGLPIVFDNFVWVTREALLARLKQELPLFMPVLPESSGLTPDIIRVLEQEVADHGLKAQVKYDDRFWTLRGMNVFFVDKISTPISSLRIEGDNPPSADAVQKWALFYTKENFSMASLSWVIRWAIRDLYSSRGYLRPVVADPVIQPLDPRDGAYPVRVVLKISSGELYTFASVKFEGLATQQTPALLAKWKLKPGEPYNETYVQNFISDEILTEPWAQHSQSESDVALPCTAIDETSRKVFLTIRLGAPKKTYPNANAGKNCGEMEQGLNFMGP